MKRVGLLGAGSIGTALIEAFEHGRAPAHQLCAVLVRTRQRQTLARLEQQGVTVTDDLTTFLQICPDVVIEAAGHEAAREVGPQVLRAGGDFHLMSVGVFADETVRSSFKNAASRGRSRVVVPSGALAGFDGLRAMAELGLVEVVYTCTKPPHAWSGTPGEALIRGGKAASSVTIFEGNAADAAFHYPKNANLAAAVALAGLGFEQTLIRLISDPEAVDNVGVLWARTREGALEVTMAGSAFKRNPKSSQITAASILAALRNSLSAIQYC